MNRLFIVDPTAEFKGHALNTMSCKEGTPQYVDYQDKPTTLEEYKIQKNNPHLIALDWDVFYKDWYEPYLIGLQKDWEEITEERYWEMLEVLPPVRWTQGIISFFFISEAYTANLHSCIIKDATDKNNPKYYEALRGIDTPAEKLVKNYLTWRDSQK